MKFVIDTEKAPDALEEHARFMLRKGLEEAKLPRINAATRALIPSWCDECSGRAWGPVMGGPTYCPACREIRAKKKEPGF